MDTNANKKQSTTKRNLILLIIILLLILIVRSLVFLLKNPNVDITPGTSTYLSNNSVISVTVPNKYEFSVVEDNSYLLELRSTKISSNVFISENSAINIRDIKKFVSSDKNDYISKFPNISNVSDISETTVNNLTTYNYNFYYKGNMFVDVYWILKDDKLYVIDFNINTDNSDFYSNRQEVLNTLVIN